MEIDDKILLIETVCGNDFYLENVITRIRKFGGVVAGVLVVLNVCEGEYVNLIAEKEPVYSLLNLFDSSTMSLVVYWISIFLSSFSNSIFSTLESKICIVY